MSQRCGKSLYLIFSVWILNLSGSSAQYYGKLLGDFQNPIHEVNGTVYVVNETTLFIKDFIYDGQGPDAHFWAGDTDQPSPRGYIVPDETGSEGVLSRYSNQDLVITLPEGKTFKDIKWFAVWCRKFAALFGQVPIPVDLVPPAPKTLGPLPTYGHGVRSGPVVVRDAKTIFIPNLYYDGAAPDAFFLVGNSSRISAKGAVKVPHEGGGEDYRIKQGFQGKDITLTLPNDLTVFNIDWLSMYCIKFSENFGHVTFPKDLDVPPVLSLMKRAVKGSSKMSLLRYKGLKLGDFERTKHNVKGTVYAVNKNSFLIEGFSYDGAGPDAYFWAGTTPSPSSDGFIVPDELGTTNILPAYQDRNIIIELPKGKTIQDIKWLAVWCRKAVTSFGNVMIPYNFQAPQEQPIGSIPSFGHGTRSGPVVIRDAKTISISGLYYDGAAPDAFFLVGMGDKPNQNGMKVPDENGSLEKLKGYQGKDIVLRLPDDLTVFDIGWLSLYCLTAKENFGHVNIPKSLNVPADIQALKSLNVQFETCQELFDGKMQVWWKVVGEQIYIQLQGQIGEKEYMSFGISGDESTAKMIGADVTVVFFDHGEQMAKAVDYILTSKSQCSKDDGVCPDQKLNGRSDVELVSYLKMNGILSVVYKRPLRTGDQQDLPFMPSDEQSVVAAIGPVNSAGEAAYHTHRNQETIKIKFGRKESPSRCKPLLEMEDNQPTAEPIDGAFPKFTIRNTNIISAKIGPPGGRKGYTAITGIQGWGIAWWMNDLLIPEIFVVRGQNYTFIVEGGDDPTIPASYHPLYITNNQEGGVGQTPTLIESSQHRIFAGLKQDINGNYIPIGVGRLCEYKHITVDQSEKVTTFEEFKKTIQLKCDPGEAGKFTWMPDHNTPDLVYYQCFTHRNLGWKIHVSDVTDMAVSIRACGLLTFLIVCLTKLIFS